MDLPDVVVNNNFMCNKQFPIINRYYEVDLPDVVVNNNFMCNK